MKPIFYIGLSNSNTGHEIPISHQKQPGLQSEMKGPDPVSKQVPTEDGGYQAYKAAGKLEGKKAIITGGDSGIGRAIAILYAMEGADCLINYLPEEESDAQETKKQVEKHSRKCYLYPGDITKPEVCKAIVDEALKQMGTINILVNNAAYQMMKHDISELSEYVPVPHLHSHFLTYWKLISLPASPKKRTMAQNLRHKHPLLLLHVQIHPAAPPPRRHNHQLRFHKRLHRPPGPPGLHIHQGCHHQLHARAFQPANRQGYPCECGVSRPGLDAADSEHDGRSGAGAVYESDGQTGAAE